MTEDNLFFKEINSKEKFLLLLEKATDQADGNYNAALEAISFLDKDILTNNLQKLKKLSFFEEKRFLSLLHYIDENMNVGSRKQKNKVRKLMVTLESLNYLENAHYFYYSNSELALLADISYFEEKDFPDTAYIKYPKELLKAIINKTKDYMKLENLTFLVEKLYSENKSVTEIIEYFTETPLEQLLQESFTYENKIVGEFDETRRI